MQNENIVFGCSECGGKEASAGRGRIPVSRVIEKLDAFLAVNDMEGAARHLTYWHEEAVALHDRSGELSVVNEELGHYRKMRNEEKGLAATARCMELLEELHQADTVAGATILLNAATTLKAFGKAEEALPIFDRALEIYLRELPQNDLRFAGFYNNFALALVDLSRYEEALACYEKALQVLHANRENAPDEAVTRVNMAHLYDAWHHEAGEGEITACLNEAERVLENAAPRDSYYAFVCAKCAPSFDYFGFFAYAAELRTRSEKIYAGA